MTGFVAATGKVYVCPDTTHDPLYIEGAAGSRSSLTVPLIIHGTVIGTLNVESPQPDAFDDRDRQFIEIYGRNIAAALEHAGAAAGREAQHGQRIGRGDQPRAGHAAGRHHHGCDDRPGPLRQATMKTSSPSCAICFIEHGRSAGLIHKAGSTIVPQPQQARPVPTRTAANRSYPGRRCRRGRSPGRLTTCSLPGAAVETARNAHEAIALMRQAPYSAALVDIRLPDLDGYEAFKRLREVQPNVPVILMTGFG